MKHITGKIEVSVDAYIPDHVWDHLKAEYKKDGMTEAEFHHDMLCDFNTRSKEIRRGDTDKDWCRYASELWGEFEDVSVEDKPPKG